MPLLLQSSIWPQDADSVCFVVCWLDCLSIFAAPHYGLPLQMIQTQYCATGGASVSFHSLVAATLGAVSCVPLLMLRAGMWTSEARRHFPVLEELQRWQAEQSSPIVRDMSPAQVCCHPCTIYVSCAPAVLCLSCPPFAVGLHTHQQVVVMTQRHHLLWHVAPILKCLQIYLITSMYEEHCCHPMHSIHTHFLYILYNFMVCKVSICVCKGLVSVLPHTPAAPIVVCSWSW